MTDLIPRLGWAITWRLTALGASVFCWRAPLLARLAVLAALAAGVVLSRWRAPGVIGSLWRLLLAVTVLYLMPTVTSGRLLLLALTLPMAIVAADVVVSVAAGIVGQATTTPKSLTNRSQNASGRELEAAAKNSRRREFEPGYEMSPDAHRYPMRIRRALVAVVALGLVLAGGALLLDLELAIPG